MPTVTEGLVNPYMGISTLRQSIVDAIDAIDPRDVPFLSAKGWSMEAGAGQGSDSLRDACIQQTYTWQNDELIPVTTTLRAAYAVAAGVLLVAANTADYFEVDEVLVVSSGAGVTHFRVTARDLTADNISVEVLNGDAAHVSGTEVMSLGRPRTIGAQAATTGRFTTITTDSNYTEIFMDTVAVTGTQQSSEEIGVPNRLDYETHKTLQQLVIRLETNLQYGLRNTALPTSNIQPAARMGGLDYFIRVSADGNVRNASGNRLSSSGEADLKNLLDDIWSDGGSANTLMMGSFQRREMSSVLIPFVRTERTAGIAGVVVGQYEYTHGMLDILLNRYTRAAHVWAIDLSMVGIGPLKGNGRDRSFAWEPLPKDGDYERRFIVGEYTAEIRNRTRGHGLLHNLATS